MCMHTVQYSVQPSKGKYTIRVYYARILVVHNPQKIYILYVHSQWRSQDLPQGEQANHFQ